MAFEQLASLRDQLAKEAAAAKQSKNLPKKKAKPGTSIDPVILTIRLLQKQFPLAFPKKPASKVPLKIGINEDLLAQADQLAIDQNILRAAIKSWCSGLRYWDCLIEDAIRVDLNGEPAGQVSKIEADQAVRMKARLGSKKSKGGKAGAWQADTVPACPTTNTD
jgi:ProP effector